uniref:Uncharacterized protein n=1 Tax=Rhizophora mucronata TaxID=61149 RepID=A0A2P2IKT0_RHIMU
MEHHETGIYCDIVFITCKLLISVLLL